MTAVDYARARHQNVMMQLSFCQQSYDHRAPLVSEDDLFGDYEEDWEDYQEEGE